MKHFRVPAGVAGARLDAWLSLESGLSRAEVQRLIESGSVTLDGERARKSSRLYQDQLVEVAESAAIETEAKADPAVFWLRYEDDDIAVVSKPPGVVVHPAGPPRGTTLVEALRERMPLAPAAGEARPGIVHRLDKDTSGLLVVAKTDEAYRALVGAIQRREVKRVYRALVLGKFDLPTGRIEAPIGRSRRSPITMSVAGAGRDATTEFKVLEEPGGLSLLEVTLVTGRTHQIRVHLSHIGHPVVGDRTYGRKTMTIASALGLDRPFLHAASLEFRHPITGEELVVNEPLPEDLTNALQRARGLT